MQPILIKNVLDAFNVKKFRKMNSALMSQHVQSVIVFRTSSTLKKSLHIIPQC